MAKVKKEVTKDESKKALSIMADEQFNTEFSTLLKTRYPLFFITTNEERRLLRFLDHFSRVRGYQCLIWDCFRGLIDLDSGEVAGGIDETIKEPLPILEHILNEGKNYINNKEAVEKKRGEGTRGIIFVLLDYFRFIDDNPDIERRLKAISSLEGIVSTIITGPAYKATSTLENLIPVLNFPYPNREEIRTALWELVDSIASKIPAITDKTKKQEEELINSVSGLTLMESQTAFAKSIVCSKGWDIPTILQEKRQIIKKSGILDFYDNVASMSDVGGLKNLIEWIKSRKDCFSSQAEDYGLSKPRGLLTLGLPGTGKSLVCKAISGEWEMPLLRLDFGKLFDSLVGQSEARARDALNLAESIAPCILGETFVTINEDKKITIEDLFNEELSDDSNGYSIFDEDEKEIKKVVYINKRKKIEIEGFDKSVKNIELKAITRTPIKENLIKITTKSGKSIITTKDHLLMDGKKNMKKAKDFKEKERISIVYNNNIQGDVDGKEKKF